MDSDDEIIGQVLRGQTHRYSLLVERYQGPIYNLMFRFCRSELEAADLSQDTFLRAYERLDGFNRNKQFFTWLYTLALNLARDWQRKNSRQLRQLDELRWQDSELNQTPAPEQQVMADEEHRRLFRALDQLDEETREIVLARYRHELAIREIAEMFGLGESAVKMRISRALSRMQATLTE